MQHFCICSRLFRFEASHYERIVKDSGVLESRKIFGDAEEPHGHNYEVSVNLFGPIDPVTGMVVELGTIDEKLNVFLGCLDHKNLATLPYLNVHRTPITQEFITIHISKKLRENIPYLRSIRLSERNGDSQVFLHEEEPMKVYHTKVFNFNAQHSLYSTALSASDNHRVFGKCVMPHGHDYTLKVTISGAPNERTNKLLIENKFEKGIEDLLTRFDYSDINSLPEFSRKRPATTENIVKVLYDHIRVIIGKLQRSEYAGDDVELAFLELQETNKNRFLYFGESTPTQATTEASAL